jgi:hypothetical protein
LQRIRQELIDDGSPQAAASAPTPQPPRHAGITLAAVFFGLSRVPEFSLQRHAMVLGRRPDEFPEQNQILHLIGAEVFDLISNIAIGGIDPMLNANHG